MKTLKNLFTALFAVALLTSFVACSNGDDEEDSKYGCGELANTEWVMVGSDNTTPIEIGGKTYTVKFTGTKFTGNQYKDKEGNQISYDVIINETDKTFKLYYGGVDMEQEFKYEFKNEGKTLAAISQKNVLGEWDDLGTYKKTN